MMEHDQLSPRWRDSPVQYFNWRPIHEGLRRRDNSHERM
jgi:hypothetical protein